MPQHKADITPRAEADWSFLDEPFVTEAIDLAVHRASRYGTDTLEDLRHDCYIWLCTRPEIIARYVESGEQSHLATRIYSDALKPRAEKESAVQSRTVGIEGLEELL